jgi:hypothetical protein
MDLKSNWIPIRLLLKRRNNMLDIMDKSGKVVAVLMDDGSVVKRDKMTDDLDLMVKEKIKEANKGRK